MPTELRLARLGSEVALSLTPEARVARLATEVAFSTRPELRVGRMGAEVALTTLPEVRVGRVGAEVAYTPPFVPTELRLGRVGAEVAFASRPEVRLGWLGTEVAFATHPEVRLGRLGAEVAITPVTTGSGTLTLPLPVFAGTAAVTLVGTGTLTLPFIIVAGQGGPRVGSGQLTLLPLLPTGAGTVVSVGSGTLELFIPIFDGTGKYTSPPVISPQTPAGLEVIVGVTTRLGSVASAEGGVANVEFFINGASIGSTTRYPYSVLWTPTTGTKTLTSRVNGTNGGYAESTPTTITVIAQPPVAPGGWGRQVA